MKYLFNYQSFINENKLIRERIVLTGAPGTGKTSVLGGLGNLGYNIIEEPARHLLLKLKREDKKWWENLQTNKIVKQMLNIIPSDDREIFQQLVEKQNIINWELNKYGYFDRSLVDEIGFRNYYKKGVSESLMSDCKKYKYDKIFFFEPWKEIFINDSERKETFEQTEEISKYLIEGYKSMNYNLIIVPKLPTKERMNFIINYK